MILFVKPTIREFPIWVMFCIFPFISLASWAIGAGEVNYDPFYIGMTALLLLKLLFNGRFHLQKRYIKFLMVLAALIILKYVLPWTYLNDLSLKASLMDGKWVCFIVFAILWVNAYGCPDLERTYRAGVFFSAVYIFKALLILLQGNDLSRGGLLLEANYDGFMILIIYCFSTEIKNKKKWENFILLLATFLTLSRTGFASLFAVWIIRVMRRNVFLLIPIVPVILVMMYYGIAMRGSASVEHMDRFVYWEQAFVAFEREDYLQLLFGNIPGKSLEMPIIPEFAWTVDTFEEMRNLRGVYPFMFHSTYLRLAFTWGIPVALLFIAYFIKKFHKSNYLPLKLLCLITLIQSFSLSSLTLSNVSPLLFIMLLTAFKKEIELFRL